MQPIKLVWPGGEHAFRLRLGEIRALQQARDAGPEQIFNRLRVGDWKVDDVIQVIRWGLVGSGEMKADRAAIFVTELVDLTPLTELKMTATGVLAHALMRLPEGDDASGEAEGGTEAPLDDGTSEPSTETAP